MCTYIILQTSFWSLQWPSSNMPDCGLCDPRTESHHMQLCEHCEKNTVIYSFKHGLHTLNAP